MRERDPEIIRLLDRLLALESGPWPQTQTAYAEVLLALALGCERRAGQAEFYRWAREAFAALTVQRSPTYAMARTDAIGSITTESAGLFLRWRAGLDHRRRPNFRSMLRARIIWRARRIMESHYLRHTRREERDLLLEDEHGQAPRAPVMVEAREVCEQLAAADHPAAQALLLVGAGHSIAEAARQSGASRQQIYRFREVLQRSLGPQ